MGEFCKPYNEPSILFSKYNQMQIDWVTAVSFATSGSFRINYTFFDSREYEFHMKLKKLFKPTVWDK